MLYASIHYCKWVLRGKAQNGASYFKPPSHIESPPEVIIATQQRMFGRRNVEQRQCDIDLIHAMYDLTRHERQLAGEPLAL